MSVPPQQRQTRTNQGRASRTTAHNHPPYYGFHIAASAASAGAAAGAATTTSATTSATATGQPLPPNGAMINGIALPGPGQTPQAMYPAITHFTDAITALPREFQRHASLLKEVDSKAWRLEEVLSQQLDSASQTTPFAALVDDYLEGSVSAPQDKPSQPSHESIILPFARRKHFSELHSTLTELMVTADEKNHVLWNANNELSKHIYRLETVYQYVQGEVSEDTRLGNKHHWAYWKKPEKPARTSDRPRRETTHASEAHKDAAASTRRRRTNKDRTEDDESTKGSRRGGAHQTGPAPKRRRVDKSEKSSTTATTNAASVAMERTASNATVTQQGRTTSKDADGTAATATTAAKPRRRNAAGTTSRRRNNTGGVSAHGSPMPTTASLARNYATASPLATSVRLVNSRTSGNAGPAASNARFRPSPAASSTRTSGNVGRGSVIRDEQNTSYESKYSETSLKREDLQNLSLETSVEAPVYSRARSSKTSTPVTAEAQALSTSSGRTTRHNNGNGRRGGGSSSNATKKNSSNNSHAAPDDESEREQRDNKSGGNYRSPSPESIPPTFLGPRLTMENTESQFAPSRPQRSNAQNRNAANNSSHGDRDSQYLQRRQTQQPIDDDEIMEDESESEPRYCYCNGVSYGEMVACDKEDCEREWFHLSCVGLSKPPGKNAKWYCYQCKEKMRKSKSGGK